MRFFTVIAALTAVVAAHSPAEETCSQVTVTVTKTLGHVPSAPATQAPTGPAPYPSSGVKSPVPVGTGHPIVPSGTVKPSGTGAYSTHPAQFTGAASSLKAGSVVFAGAVAALLL